MSQVFLETVNRSISASWLVLAVVLLRFVLRKTPRGIHVLLWGLVGIRLILPSLPESPWSLIPSPETIPLNIELDTTPAINSGIGSINGTINPMIEGSNTPALGASVNPLQITVAIYANLWILGMAAMLIYTTVSYLRLRRRVCDAVLLRDRIYQSENTPSPFVLGILKPRIYLSLHLDGQSQEHVIAHEKAHIRRKDHWWKAVGFLLLTVHWFNPLMWLAYTLLCRDMELACDETVIRNLDNGKRADYAQALVACSVRKSKLAACPLAFGEVGVKARVKAVAQYRKPAFWVVILTAVLCMIMAVCFLTDPISAKPYFVTCQLSDSRQTDVTCAFNSGHRAIAVAVTFEETDGPSAIELECCIEKSGEEGWESSDPVRLVLGEAATFWIPAEHHYAFFAATQDGTNGNVTLLFEEGKTKSRDMADYYTAKTLMPESGTEE